MRFRTVTHSVLASMLAAAAGMFAAAAPASAAGVADGNSVTLPMASYADIQVNAQRSEVYVAGGDQIVIADLDGNPLQTISGQSGVYGLALNADGTRLYAALHGANAVSVIDLKRKREVKRYHLGSACPGDLAFGAGKLWFSAACTQGSIVGSVGTIDLNSGAVTTHLNGLQAVFGLPLISFAVREGWPTKLVIAARDLSYTSLRTYDLTADGTIDPQCWGPGPCRLDWPEIAQDMAVTGDGADIVLAGDNQYHTLMTVVGLAVVRTYPTGANPRAVAVGANSQLALGAQSPIGSDNDLFGYEQTADQASWTYDFGMRPTAYNDVAPRGLAFAAGNARLYAVVTDNDGSDPVLHTLIPTP